MSFSLPLPLTLIPRRNVSNVSTVDDASTGLAYRVRSRQGAVAMVVPASMAMVRVPCCGFEIFYFWPGFFLFLFSCPPFLPLIASYCPSFHFLLPLLRDTDFSHLTLVPHTFLAVPREEQRNSCLTVPGVSRICIQKGPTLPAASRASLGRSISRSPFSLGLRLPRCEMHAVLYLAIDFLMPAPVHRAPASIVPIDF